jgi:membrane-bound lytic murein transglycosylase B
VHVTDPTASTPPAEPAGETAAQTAADGEGKHHLRPAGTPPVAPASPWPYEQLAVRGLVAAAVVAVTVVLGAVLVPGLSGRPAAAENTAAAASGSPTPSTVASASPSPSPFVSTSPHAPNAGLTEWANRLAVKVEIPPVALRAYGYAEWVLSQNKPACRLTWTTLAAIGKVESNHGRIGASSLGADGRALPPIVGPALDGKDGRKKIVDTDAGALDNDRAFDHAVGPMQFLPATWRTFAVDADGDGISDPSDVDDAALAAAYQLCAANKDLGVTANWTAAVLGYNNVSKYLQDVYAAANTFGQKSRT